MTSRTRRKNEKDLNLVETPEPEKRIASVSPGSGPCHLRQGILLV